VWAAVATRKGKSQRARVGWSSKSMLGAYRLHAPCRHPVVVAAVPDSLDAADILQQCDGSATRLASLLSKEQLKLQCAHRKLRLSGTKLQLAPRLLDALRSEIASDPGHEPPEPVVPPPSPPPSDPKRDMDRPKRVASKKMPQLLSPDDGVPAAAGPDDEQIGSVARYDMRGALIEVASPPDAAAGSGADLELTVLGSGACSPSPWRGASCVALRVRDSYWLFDVGEGTQVQLQRSSVRPSKIDRIYITHAHGDHCFGLPGLLCLIARGRDADAPPVQIYGPHGLRAFVRVSLAFTGTRMLPPYVIHELHDIPDLRRARGHGRPPISSRPASNDGPGRGEWGEVGGGTDLRPADDDTWWTLGASKEGLRVSAVPMHHSVPCVGYVVAEDDKPGRLLVEKVMPALEANRVAIREEMGLKDPKALMKKVKLLGQDDEMQLPDGTVLRGREVLGETRRGRKVVILGDTCDASLCEGIGRGADLVVHEATNAHLPQFGDRGDLRQIERETRRHGHSTPQMAGRFARRIGARSLLLTHFSQRYHPGNRKTMAAIASQAVAESGLPAECVAPAYDGLTLPLWQADRGKPLMPPEAFAAPPSRTQSE
jgi:ribonuclease Z